ncbi:MAG: class I SAM-dependent methyltransferase [Verrucomicrobia bacterium]|nr:MAG: class I SAM-dependent methyltransferase [Verrucomicrobiota bacterium]TAE86056.1 MAG: class I SAM-dependent methyltransferase [Verrucomicrobiota bacterium]TAF25845.1 MAG: class I SAM-dependent methyltransferase [Verrucomicrobiota bacterium]
MPLKLTHPNQVPHPAAEAMLPAIGGFPTSDRPLFLAGYSELCRIDLNGKRVLEICGGHGKLAAAVARSFPSAEVMGLDLYAVSGPEADEWCRQSPGLSYIAGDAFDLSRFEADSLDLVWGQAALHHLAHDIDGLCVQVARVLKPGGRFVFIFEPMGHNLAVAAIRAIRMAREELGDESNLYLSQFEKMARYFGACEVQMFNLLGYPLKAFSDRFRPLCRLVQRADAALFGRFPGLLRYGANCNVVFTKSL